jgi:hypothetical protein
MPDSPNNNPADAITDALAEDMRVAFDAIGQELEDRFRELVSVPVEYEGKRVIRSKPGERPRLETGRYQESFRHTTNVDGDKVRTEAGTTDKRGAFFTAGTSRMKPRPHAEQVREEFMESGEQRILTALSNPTGV